MRSKISHLGTFKLGCHLHLPLLPPTLCSYRCTHTPCGRQRECNAAAPFMRMWRRGSADTLLGMAREKIRLDRILASESIRVGENLPSFQCADCSAEGSGRHLRGRCSIARWPFSPQYISKPAV